MYVDQESIFYYLTVMNEQYAMPPMPEGARDGILKGLYRFRAASKPNAPLRAQLFGSGAILPEVIKAQEILESKYDVGADVWSVTSYSELYRDGHACERWNMLHPGDTPRVPYVDAVPEGRAGRVRRGVRLREGAARLDRPLAAAAAHDARHRRLRPQRDARRTAGVLRSRLPLRHRRDARGAGARRKDRRVGRRAGDQGAQHQSREEQPCDLVTITNQGGHRRGTIWFRYPIEPASPVCSVAESFLGN